MNYRIYHEGHEFQYTFNFIKSVGDLQTVILQALNIRKDKLLFVMYQNKILGKDYAFDDDLAEKNLVDVNLFVVIDPYQVEEGTKEEYNQWLQDQIQNNDLVSCHQQLMYFNTSHDTNTPNLDFFTQPILRARREQESRERRSGGAEANRERNRNTGQAVGGGQSNSGLQTRSREGQSWVEGRRPLRPDRAPPAPPSQSEQSPAIYRRRRRLVRSNQGLGNGNGGLGNGGLGNGFLLNSLLGGGGAGLGTGGGAGLGTGGGAGLGTGGGAGLGTGGGAGLGTGGGAGLGGNGMGAGGSETSSSDLNVSGDAPAGGNLQSMLQNLMTGQDLGGGALSGIFNEMLSQNIYDLGVTMTQGPNGNSIGVVASGTVGGNSDFFQRLLSDLEPVPVTLDQESINQLPTFKFSEVPEEIQESQTCSICLEEFGGDDQVRVLWCKHYFHTGCIDRWLAQENVRCPLCRHDSREGGEEEVTERTGNQEGEVGGVVLTEESIEEKVDPVVDDPVVDDLIEDNQVVDESKENKVKRVKKSSKDKSEGRKEKKEKKQKKLKENSHSVKDDE